MKILVTGANGYIGQHVVKVLLDLGHSVIAVDLSTENIDERAEIHTYNVFEDIQSAKNDCEKSDVLLHLVWEDVYNHNSMKQLINLPKHVQFIELAMQSGINMVASMGSMHDIGYWEGKIDENTPAKPLSYYGIAKNALLQCVGILADKYAKPYLWLRCFYTCGNDEKSNTIFTKIVKMASDGQKTFPFTTGENKYDFSNINDVAKQIATAITQRKYTGVVHCCSGTAVSLKEKVEEFIQEHNLDIRPDYGKYPSRPYDSPIVYGDNTKISIIMKEFANE